MTYCYDSEPKPNRSLDVFIPESPSHESAVLFVHGGGWIGGTKTVFHPIMTALTKLGWICGSLDYRLSGVTALNQVEDVHSGRELFIEKLRAMGQSGYLVLLGSSAGAHLALLEGMINRDDYVKGIVAVSAPVTFELWDNIFPPIKDAMVSIAGAPYADNPELYRTLSPIHQINNDTPPVCLMDGANEHMFPHNLTEKFVEKMHKYNRLVEHHVYANAEHGFFYDVTRTCQQKAFADLTEFLSKV